MSIKSHLFTVERTPAGFVACLGEYDLDAPVAYGSSEVDAIIDWLETHGDLLSGGDA